MDDATLWEHFHSCTLPRDAWTHRAHVRMAWMYRRRHALDEAHVLLRIGIVKLNASHGLVETVLRGYHETITRAWLALVGASTSSAPKWPSPRSSPSTRASDSSRCRRAPHSSPPTSRRSPTPSAARGFARRSRRDSRAA
jgi:hypothetical protein